MKTTLKVILVSIGALACIPAALIYSSHRNQKSLDQDLVDYVTGKRTDVAPVQSLVERGANVNSRYVEPDTPADGIPALSVAAAKGKDGVVSFLLDKGANIELKDPRGATPLMHAAAWRHVSTVQLLLSRGANPSVKTPKGRTALVMSEDLLERSLKLDAKHRSPTQTAAHRKIVQLLKHAQAK